MKLINKESLTNRQKAALNSVIMAMSNLKGEHELTVLSNWEMSYNKYNYNPNSGYVECHLEDWGITISASESNPCYVTYCITNECGELYEYNTFEELVMDSKELINA